MLGYNSVSVSRRRWLHPKGCWLAGCCDGPVLELALPLPAGFYYVCPGMVPLFSLLPVSHPRLLSWGPKLKILSCCFLALRARGPYLFAAGFLKLLIHTLAPRIWCSWIL